MARNEPIEVAHLVELAWDRRPWGRGVRAECSCGWLGDWRTDITAAAADGIDHRDITVGSGDGLDGVICTLLDLQDDLADTVVWLAENWSADLPVPEMRDLGPGGALVRLSAYCASAGDLERAAAILDVSPTDDARPDCRGNRYRRATRQFGTVSLQVFRALAPTCGDCEIELADASCPSCASSVDQGTAERGAA